MTDDIKFYDPETGAELHRVPKGATIPGHMPYGLIEDGKHWWCPQGLAVYRGQGDDIPRFTREPIAPPKPPLPTEPGSLIRAVNTDGDECAVMIRLEGGGWFGVDQDGVYRMWNDKIITSWEPMTAVPTVTWDRLRALDPEDKRDRVDSEGRVWRYSKKHDRWDNENGNCFYYLEAMDSQIGPFRFADEVSDR